MTQKAKPDFAKFGITVAKIGNSCGDILYGAHSGQICFVGDTNTMAAAATLLPKGCKKLEFHQPPVANEETVNQLREETQQADILVAVGSGTLNDLCKYASFIDGKAYSVIATAPSMNGYVSANASITVDGFKKTLPAQAPEQVLCDIPTLSAAPAPLIQAGIGDTLCRTTLQADWLLSHLLLGTAYEPTYFDWLSESEARLLNDPNDSKALIDAILLSGIAMRDFGSSAPASQGEHMLAHTVEMLFPTLPHTYHGLAIAVTSLTLARRQQQLLDSDRARIHFTPELFEEMPAYLRAEAEAQYHRKLPDIQTVDTLNRKLSAEWSHIAPQIAKVTLPPAQLEKALKAAGCPISPAQINWPEEHYAQAQKLAPLTRDRFTFLDICR